MGSALSASVLVLNRSYTAVHVVGVRRAFRLLCKDHAEVVLQTGNEWNSYDFESWVQLSQSRHLFREEEGDWVHTVRLSIRVPKVIRLLLFDRKPSRAVKFNRRNIFARDGSGIVRLQFASGETSVSSTQLVFARDGGRCQYCGRRFPTPELSLDHVVPRSQGGLSTWENVVCACARCNARKGGRLPQEAGMTLVQKPYRPKSSPVVQLKLASPKYQSWKHFVDEAYWSVPLKD